MKFSIRKTTNMELIDELQKIILPFDKPYHSENCDCWVVFFSGTPVGFAVISYPGSDFAFLARSGIKKEYRGHGLQRRLIAVRERYARKLGIPRIITYTMPDNVESSRNIVKMGYLPYIPEWEYAGKVLYWEKSLI